MKSKKSKLPTDTEMLDWLDEQTKKHRYTGRVLFRWSFTGRGWRLHETSMEGAVPDVREAIANAMRGGDHA